MYPGMIWRHEAPVPIKHVHIGDEDLVFVQPGETDHVLYIGAFNKTGGNIAGNTDGKAGSPTVTVQNNIGDNTGNKEGGKTGGKTGGETNVILLDADNGVIANILIVALPSYLREDEGLVRILRNDGYTTYQCNPHHCRGVPTWLPQPK
jgi:hypothetical protein